MRNHLDGVNSAMNSINGRCRICSSSKVEAIGTKVGSLSRREFEICRCYVCGYVWVSNPETDMTKLYGKDYYLGKGGDPLTNYLYEMEHPQLTVRNYEWRGIVKIANTFIPGVSRLWLDYACGNAGLVNYLNQNGLASAYGIEEGWIAGEARQRGLPILTLRELDEYHGAFDIVTAIEVLEHTPSPLETLRLIRKMFKVGGLFFFTTGNLEPFTHDLLNWRYLIPELHVSLFEPKTMMLALQRSGFRPIPSEWSDGWVDIVRFKILKNLGVKNMNLLEKILPWNILTKLISDRFGLSAYPIGVAV